MKLFFDRQLCENTFVAVEGWALWRLASCQKIIMANTWWPWLIASRVLLLAAPEVAELGFTLAYLCTKCAVMPGLYIGQQLTEFTALQFLFFYSSYLCVLQQVMVMHFLDWSDYTFVEPKGVLRTTLPLIWEHRLRQDHFTFVICFGGTSLIPFQGSTFMDSAAELVLVCLLGRVIVWSIQFDV